MKGMEFKSKVDVTIPVKEASELTDDNIESYIENWFNDLEEDISEFRTNIKNEKLQDLDLDYNDIYDLGIAIKNWFNYIRNSLINITPLKDTIDQTKIISLREVRNLLGDVLAEFNDVIILQLDETAFIHIGKYRRSYLDEVLEKITDSVKKLLELLVEFLRLSLFINWNCQALIKLLLEMGNKLENVLFYYKRFNAISRPIGNSTALKELLGKFQLNQALSRLESAEEFYNMGIWDKAVADMRITLEVVVRELVRKIQNDSNWNSTYGDGIGILFENGIVLDKTTCEHLRAKNIGIYGLLSVKGHHPNDEGSHNLANCEFEAKYFSSLTNNVIEYLLTSFRKSEFYEGEE